MRLGPNGFLTGAPGAAAESLFATKLNGAAVINMRGQVALPVISVFCLGLVLSTTYR